MDAGRHPRIQVISNAEVVGCEGGPGEFSVRVRKNPRYVIEDKCVACGLCVDACPQVGGNEFDAGLMARKAIYRSFPQSVPAAYIIDSESCLNFASLRRQRDAKGDSKEPITATPNVLVCNHCDDVCDVDAIDFDQTTEEIDLDVGAILVAIGFQEFDASQLGNYGYGQLPNVVTSLELERLLNASGVTQGHVIRPSDRKTPKRIVFIQCVGARGEGGRPYCSRFCCMNAVKDSMLIRQHDPEVEEITILHTDIRAFGKGFDDFVKRSQDEESAIYVRGRPAKVSHIPEDDTLEIFVEDTLSHKQKRIVADMVVLSVAAAPNDGARKLAKIIGIETDLYGFIAREDPAVSAVETNQEGIYACGSAVGPQVIPDCVAQASAAAARAELYLAGHRIMEDPEPPIPMDMSGPPRVGVMVCSCGVNIGGILDTDDLAQYAGDLNAVVVQQQDLFACASTGQEALVEMVKEHNLNRVVIAACTPRTHEPIFRETLYRMGFNPYLLEMVNIRDQCSWVHANTREFAQEKARTLIRMGVARAQHLEPLTEGTASMQRAALVIGGGIAGIQAATDLAVQGFPVTLVEKTDKLGGRLAAPNLKLLYPNLRPAQDVLDDKLGRLEKSGARVLLNTTVENVTGFVGSFEATLSGQVDETLQIGAIILAFGADLYNPGSAYRYDKLKNVITSEELEQAFCAGDDLSFGAKKQPQSAAFILCVGSRCDEFTGCSRYCCATAIKQALELNRKGIDTTVLYRDIRTVSTGSEEMYRQARGEGVLFIRVPKGEEVEVIGARRASAVQCHDQLLGRRIEAPADVVILSTGMRARQPETAHFHELLKPSLGLDGFFLERHPELAPVETAVEGILLAGTVQGPKDIVDTVAQASASAAKAAVFLSHDEVKLDPAVCEVANEDDCRGCGACVDICQYQAPQLVESPPGFWTVSINPSLCKGCGTCASWCPSGAIVARHFTDRQVVSMIDAFFGEGTEAAP